MCFSTLAITSCGNEKYTKSLKFVQHIEDSSYAVIGIDKVAKDKNIVIPSVYKKLPVTEICYEAFKKCYSITRVTIGNNVISIGDYAFYDCDSLTNVTIGNNVEKIGVGAFKSCGKLTRIIIPNSVTSIEDGAFGECYSITSITIPSSVTNVGHNPFYECISLKTIFYAGTEKQWNSIIYYNDTKFFLSNNKVTVIYNCK